MASEGAASWLVVGGLPCTAAAAGIPGLCPELHTLVPQIQSAAI